MYRMNGSSRRSIYALGGIWTTSANVIFNGPYRLQSTPMTHAYSRSISARSIASEMVMPSSFIPVIRLISIVDSPEQSCDLLEYREHLSDRCPSLIHRIYDMSLSER